MACGIFQPIQPSEQILIDVKHETSIKPNEVGFMTEEAAKRHFLMSININNEFPEKIERQQASHLTSRVWSFIKNHATKETLLIAGSLVITAVVATCRSIYG